MTPTLTPTPYLIMVRIWCFDFPSADNPASGWRVLHEFGGAGAEQAARSFYRDNLRWRVAYGELFAVTVGGRQPLPVCSDCLPF